MNTFAFALILFLAGGTIGYLRLEAIKLERFQDNIKNGDVVVVKINGTPTKCIVWCLADNHRVVVIDTQTGSKLLVGIRDVHPYTTK